MVVLHGPRGRKVQLPFPFGGTPLARASAEISVHTPHAPTLLLVQRTNVTEGRRNGGMCEG